MMTSIFLDRIITIINELENTFMAKAQHYDNLQRNHNF